MIKKTFIFFRKYPLFTVALLAASLLNKGTTTLKKDLDGVKKIIVSSNPNYSLVDGYELVSSLLEALSLLDNLGIRHALVDGGSQLNRSFLLASLVDEIRLPLEPVVAPTDLDIELKLLSVDKWPGEELSLKYKVIQGEKK